MNAYSTRTVAAGQLASLAAHGKVLQDNLALAQSVNASANTLSLIHQMNALFPDARIVKAKRTSSGYGYGYGYGDPKSKHVFKVVIEGQCYSKSTIDRLLPHVMDWAPSLARQWKETQARLVAEERAQRKLREACNALALLLGYINFKAAPAQEETGDAQPETAIEARNELNAKEPETSTASAMPTLPTDFVIDPAELAPKTKPKKMRAIEEPQRMRVHRGAKQKIAFAFRKVAADMRLPFVRLRRLTDPITLEDFRKMLAEDCKIKMYIEPARVDSWRSSYSQTYETPRDMFYICVERKSIKRKFTGFQSDLEDLRQNVFEIAMMKGYLRREERPLRHLTIT